MKANSKWNGEGMESGGWVGGWMAGRRMGGDLALWCGKEGE